MRLRDCTDTPSSWCCYGKVYQHGVPSDPSSPCLLYYLPQKTPNIVWPLRRSISLNHYSEWSQYSAIAMPCNPERQPTKRRVLYWGHCWTRTGTVTTWIPPNGRARLPDLVRDLLAQSIFGKDHRHSSWRNHTIGTSKLFDSQSLN